MKVLVPLCLLIVVALGSSSSPRRYRRDLVCAIRGNTSCNIYCKGKGFKDGECVWDEETKAYDCDCDPEKRGIRCNLGGPNTCHYSCVFIGYREGHCGAGDKCECGGGYNRWGNLLQNIGDRL